MKVSVAGTMGWVCVALGLCCAAASGQLSGYTSSNAFPGLNFSSPVCIAAPPGETNRLFIVEQRGVIVVITNLANPTRTVFLDITDRVSGGGELGLLGLAFHPGFASNHLFYVFYTGSATNGSGGLHDILSRFQAWTAPWDSDMADPDSEVRLIAQMDQAANHNGGDLHFGPDNYLYVSLGDEGDGDDSFNNSQRIDKDFFSGILRLDVDKRPGSLTPHAHPASSTNYAIPSDNPYVGVNSFNGAMVSPANVRTEFWAVGLRNPWRYSFDSMTGYLYCGDVGQGAREEVDIITKGGNYGWAYREGNIAGPKTPPGGFSSIPPIRDYGRSDGNCIIGGVVYRGSRFPDLFGYYIYADFGSGTVWALTYDGLNTSASQELFNDGGISAFGTDPSNGDVLYANLNGTINRVLTVAPPGSLQVTIDPAGALTSGAQWRVNNGPFLESGATVSGLAVGTHMVTFKSVPGWDEPNNFTVAVSSATTTATNGTYVSTDHTKPTIAFTAPKSGQRLSNEVFMATGTVKDNALVTEVWCQLNSDAWVLAAGTTNWSVANLHLVPGNNTLRAYAVDVGNNVSKTNSVTCFYVVSVPLTVQVVGSGAVNPNYDGQDLEIGKSYFMVATPRKHFGFVDWSGDASSTKTKLTFVMASNLTFIATFVDVKDPTLVVTFPTVNKKVTNTVLTVTGKASDNVGIDSVWYQLNSGGWNLANTANFWSNWLSAALVPNSGGNLLQAWAADAAGNISRTNTVKFTWSTLPSADWAPDTLSGLTAQATPDSNSPVNVSFDALTFSQTGSTNESFSVGNYTYVKTGTNLAQLNFTNSAPPTRTNDTGTSVALIFTDHYSGVFTNDEGGGPIQFVIATNFTPTTLANKKITAIGSHGTSNVSLKSNGSFTLTPPISGVGMSSVGTYTFARYSPVGAMLVLTFTGTDAGTVTYVQLTFTSAKAGTTLTTTFDNLGNPTDVDAGTFTVH